MIGRSFCTQRLNRTKMVQFAVGVGTIPAMWHARAYIYCTSKAIKCELLVLLLLTGSISFRAARLKTLKRTLMCFCLLVHVSVYVSESVSVCECATWGHGDSRTWQAANEKWQRQKDIFPRWAHLSVLFCSSLFCHFSRPLASSLSLSLSVSLGYVLWPNEPSWSVAHTTKTDWTEDRHCGCYGCMSAPWIFGSSALRFFFHIFFSSFFPATRKILAAVCSISCFKKWHRRDIDARLRQIFMKNPRHQWTLIFIFVSLILSFALCTTAIIVVIQRNKVDVAGAHRRNNNNKMERNMKQL